MQSRYFKVMLLELLVCGLHNPPGITDRIVRMDQMGKQLRYPISTFIAALMLLRCYLFLRLYSRFSIYRSTFADRCCAKVGIEADTGFSLKCSYKESPFTLLFLVFAISVIALGVAVR